MIGLEDIPQEDILTEAHARRGDPRTSQEAAASVRITDLEIVVLTALRVGGPATSFELADRLRLSLVTVSPRLRPLVSKGLVRDSGYRRRGETGRSRIVWEEAPAQGELWSRAEYAQIREVMGEA